MADFELGEMFWTIGTHQQSLDRGLSQADRKTASFFSKIESRSAGVARSLGGGLLGGLGLGAGFAAFKGIESGISAVIEAAVKHEESDAKLRASLRFTGNEVDNNAARFNKLADELRENANVEEESTRQLISYGLNLGIATDKVGEMATAAVGLAEATDGDAKSAMVNLTKAQQGNFMMLQRQIPLLKTMKTDEEKLAYVQKIATQGLNERKAQLQTLGGATTQFKLETGKLAEEIGGHLVPSLTHAAQAATSLVRNMRGAAGSGGANAPFKPTTQPTMQTPLSPKASPNLLRNLGTKLYDGFNNYQKKLQELQRLADERDQKIQKGARAGQFALTPSARDAANNRITALRNEIMSGGGPREGAAYRNIQLRKALEERNAARFGRQRTNAASNSEGFLAQMARYAAQQIAAGGGGKYVRGLVNNSLEPISRAESAALRRAKDRINANEKGYDFTFNASTSAGGKAEEMSIHEKGSQEKLQASIERLTKALDDNTRKKAAAIYGQ